MKVLMLSTDQSILDADSDSQKRMLEYGKLFEELHIIVLSQESGIMNQAIKNIFLYPTNTQFKPSYFLQAYQIGKKIIHDSKFIIHNSTITCQDPFEIGLVGWLLKLKYKLPLQIQIHTDVFSPYFWKESLKNKIRVLLAKFLLPRADGIRVVSKRIKRSLMSNVKCQMSNVSALPIFVDVKKIQSAKIKTDLHKKYPGYNSIILMASRLTKEKNIPMALEAIRGLMQIKTQINAEKILLLIVGDGPEREALQKLIVKSQLSNVIIEPWTDDLISYYKTADLFLLASNYEGYGRTIVEAMAAGLPVVMTDVGLAGELLINDKNGIVAPIGNKNALTSAIVNLIEDKTKRKQFNKESQKIINFLPPKKEYLRLYKESLENLARQKPKLVYVLPKYSEDEPTHFAYLHDFLRTITKQFDIFLVIEKGEKPADNLNCRRATLSKFRLPALLRARFLGYRDFYVHYSFAAAFWASLIAKIFGGQVFYWNCGEPWKYRRNFLREMFEKSVYRLITFLVTGTESMAEKYSEHYKIPIEKIKIMPNWINLEEVKSQKSKVKSDKLRMKLNILPQQQVVLFVHRLSKRKGAHYLPEILNGLRDENAVLIIIGDGPEREALQSNVKCQMSNVRFLGWVPQKEVLNYFAIADIFIMPSDEEGFPHVVLETMAMGVPFVASDVGGMRDISPKFMQQYIVKAGDIQRFVDKVKELLSKNPKELEAMRRLLMNRVKQYDVSAAINKFLEICQK